MAVEAILPTLATVVITAAIDSINPCAIGVLILLISTMVSSGDHRRMMWRGMVYVSAVFLTYLLAGLGLIYVFVSIPIVIAEYISIIIGIAIVFMGLIEIKDFFWYGKGFSLAISPDMAKKIHNYTENISTPGLAFLGAFVALVELPCTGGPYLAIITLLAQNFDFTALLLMILYNIIFVAPLIIILLITGFGVMKVQDLQQWKQANRPFYEACSWNFINCSWMGFNVNS